MRLDRHLTAKDLLPKIDRMFELSARKIRALARREQHTVRIDTEDDDRGSAHWVARYTFAQTGRPVVNDVRSIFRFDTAGLIVDQQDDFDFWRWARQALGRRGLLLGWTPVLQHGVRDRAMAGLEAFRNR